LTIFFLSYIFLSFSLPLLYSPFASIEIQVSQTLQVPYRFLRLVYFSLLCCFCFSDYIISIDLSWSWLILLPTCICCWASLLIFFILLLNSTVSVWSFFIIQVLVWSSMSGLS
jgi:hypothetical protein